MDEREEKKLIVNLQLTWTQEQKKIMRETSRSYINSEELITIHMGEEVGCKNSYD